MVDDTPLMADVEAGTKPSGVSGGAEVAGVSIPLLEASQLPLFLVFVSSIILLIATGAAYDWSFGITHYAGYALSVSVIAMVLSFFGLVLTKAGDEVYEKVGVPLNMLIFSYGFFGACFLTFDSPFTSTSNGYFAAWAIVYGSGLAIGMHGLQSGVRGLGSIMGLLASSLIVLIASINPIRHDDHRNEAIYALVLACITFAFLLITAKKFGDGSMGGAGFLIMSILAMCWIVQASLCTFRGPFMDTGNGYFASWTAAFSASVAAFAAMKSL